MKNGWEKYQKLEHTNSRIFRDQVPFCVQIQLMDDPIVYLQRIYKLKGNL